MTLVVRSQAQRDLRQTLQFYIDQESPATAERFANLLDKAYDEIIADPRRYPAHESGERFKPTIGFPFSVVYSIETSEIVVHAIRHHKRRPSYWH